MKNIDKKTVDSFGDEWGRFNQEELNSLEANKIFNNYFSIFPWDKLPINAVGFDMGCGSGRWAKLVSPKVGYLTCIDPSSALNIAKHNLKELDNLSFKLGSVNDHLLPNNSQDFGYSLGVLHHVPDTLSAIKSCVVMLKSGAPFLIYLYYAFDNRSILFRLIWKCSDYIRKVICKMPPTIKYLITDLLALVVYLPLSRFARIAELLGLSVDSIPLSYYRKLSFYTMRTDSRDRFGTPLEKRFTQNEIEKMMKAAGLEKVLFSDKAPYWCAVGFKK